MKVLVTGGAGFIGSHLSGRLLREGHAVDCLDDLSTGSEANVRSFIGEVGYRFFRGKTQDEQLVGRLVEGADVVFHLAATVGVAKVMADPIETIENNIFGTLVVLKLANQFKKRTFVFSTSEVYGKSPNLPYREDDDVVLGCPKRFRWSYAASKVIDEYLARAYYVHHQMPVTTVRLFNTIGRGQVGRYGMVVPTFFSQAMAGRAITIHGSGTQARSFSDVRDVTSALISLMDKQDSFGDIFNIGAEEEVSILDLAQRIKKLTGSTSEIHFTSPQSVYGDGFEDMERRIPCTKRLGKLCGCRFRFCLDESLAWIYADLQNMSVTDSRSSSV